MSHGSAKGDYIIRGMYYYHKTASELLAPWRRFPLSGLLFFQFHCGSGGATDGRREVHIEIKERAILCGYML